MKKIQIIKRERKGGKTHLKAKEVTVKSTIIMFEKKEEPNHFAKCPHVPHIQALFQEVQGEPPRSVQFALQTHF